MNNSWVTKLTIQEAYKRSYLKQRVHPNDAVKESDIENLTTVPMLANKH